MNDEQTTPLTPVNPETRPTDMPAAEGVAADPMAATAPTPEGEANSAGEGGESEPTSRVARKLLEQRREKLANQPSGAVAEPVAEPAAVDAVSGGAGSVTSGPRHPIPAPGGPGQGGRQGGYGGHGQGGQVPGQGGQGQGANQGRRRGGRGRGRGPREGANQPADAASFTAADFDTEVEVAEPLQRLARGEKVSGATLRRLMDEGIDDEMDEAMAAFDPNALLDPSAAATPDAPASNQDLAAEPKRNEKRSVRVLRVGSSDIFVDLGLKSQGVVSQMQYEDVPPDQRPQAGQWVELIVDRYDRDSDMYVMRRPGVVQEADWSTIARGMVVDAIVRKANKGGLEVTVNGIRGFIPAGQVDLYRVETFESYVGQTLRCEVTEFNQSAKRLVVSRKVIMQREKEERAKATLASLSEGKEVDGVVIRLMDFGAFVDLGGIDGMIPISQLSWVRVGHPSEVVQVGQRVRVKVIALRPDEPKGKVTLSMRSLTPSPWQLAVTKYPPGSTIDVRITRLEQYGAFGEIEPGVEGLIHISELGHGKVTRASLVVKVGQMVEVKVLSVDPEARKIGLSMRALLPDPEEKKREEEAAKRQAAAASEEAAAAATGTPAVQRPKPTQPLKGGTGTSTAGPLFKLPSK